MRVNLYLLFLLGIIGLGQPNLRAQGEATQATSALNVPTTYRLQIGDQFKVVYRLTPEYNQTVSVQPDGTATLELLGSLPIRGLTVTGAHDLIQQAAAKRLRDPELALELENWDKPHFTVLGEVGAPGRFELRGPLTVQDGIAMAGGLKLSARHNKILLIRRLNDVIGETQLIDLKTMENKPKAGMELIPLHPGDIVLVPMSKLTKIERYVRIVNFGTYAPIF